MTRQEFADKWGYQSGVGYGSAQFDCRDSLLKDLNVLIANEVKNLALPHVIVPLPDEDEITNAFVSAREQNLKMNLDYRDRDYFGLGVSFVGNWQTAKGNEL